MMQLPATVERFESASQLAGPLHLAIGMFDGVHLGHMAVIESAVFSAKQSGGTSGVLTFDPHPSRIFHPENPTQMILPISRKCERLHAVGVDLVIRKRFDRDYASLEASDFASRLQSALPALAAIYVGENFHFGKARTGNVDLLVSTGSQVGMDVISLPRIRLNGLPISSTRIREELTCGMVERANELLGYHYSADGRVVSGAALGREIGFPTMNLPWQPDCQPRYGVYCVRFRSESGQWIPGIANYGIKPTVSNENVPILEVHALLGSGFEAGTAIEVEWLRFLRPEKKFESLEALKEQIAVDVKAARTFSSDG
ncbi:MAG: riboflavin biosynthesis protein RibF [Coraliomargaritaceae bacterium]